MPKTNARRGDIDRFIETDVRFHEVLAAIPGNPIFVAINQALCGSANSAQRD